MGATCIDVVLFGEFSLSYNGNTLAEKDYRSQKMWAVLAYLIMNRQRPVTQSELIQRFWDDDEGQNPASALKTLIFRLRKLLIPLLGANCQPVVSTLGAYQWNPELPCNVDVDAFESLLHQCESRQLPPEEKLECYRQALDLYRGEFLPKAIKLSWHTMRSAYYQMQYSQAACEFAGLLESMGKHEEMTRICSQTLHQGVLEEKLYVLLIRGLLHQGNHTQALQQYEKATDILYHELGVARSSALESLYQEIMNERMKEEPDITAILEDMQDSRAPGAFFCEYGFFKEAYRMEARRVAQTGAAGHIALLTLSPTSGKTLTKEVYSHAMNALQKALCTSLRETDVVSQYSSSQFVVLLPATDYADSLRLCQHTENTFHKDWYHRIAEIHYVIRTVEPVGNEGAAQ